MINLLESLNWREPLWLLLAVQPIVIYLLVLLARRLQKDHYAEPHLLPWVKLNNNKAGTHSFLKRLLLVIAWLAFAIAMAGPRIANKIVSTDESAYTDIIVLLDVSRSMTAHDIHPSRLERAKLELLDLVQRSQRNRIGIILYAAKAHVLSPLTSDKNLLRHYISKIQSSLLPTRGSNLKGALKFIAEKYGNNTQQAILVISDGENVSQNIDDYEDILSNIKQNNIHVFSLIAGTDTGAPLLDHESGWLTFENQDIISKANTSLLSEIALRTNGTFSKINDTDDDWQLLYEKGITRIKPVSVSNQKDSDLIIWTEYYSWFLLLGIFCFTFAHLNVYSIKKPRHAASFVLVVVMITGLSNTDVVADEQYQQAYHSYLQQDYQQAEQQFSQVNNYAGRIGQASAAYQNKDYSRAIMLFIQASLDARTDAQRVHALFNLANSYYQVYKYQQAANIYQDVLRYQPNHLQAKTNLTYARNLAKKQVINKGDITTSHGGRGPRTARLAPDAEIGKGNITLGDESETLPYALSIDQGNATEQPSDVSAAGLVTQDIETKEDTSWTYQIRNISELDTMINSISSDEYIFWQRLFEWEENFPAPLAEPVHIQGVKPW